MKKRGQDKVVEIGVRVRYGFSVHPGIYFLSDKLVYVVMNVVAWPLILISKGLYKMRVK